MCGKYEIPLALLFFPVATERRETDGECGRHWLTLDCASRFYVTALYEPTEFGVVDDLDFTGCRRQRISIAFHARIGCRARLLRPFLPPCTRIPSVFLCPTAPRVEGQSLLGTKCAQCPGGAALGARGRRKATPFVRRTLRFHINVCRNGAGPLVGHRSRATRLNGRPGRNPRSSSTLGAG